jgi:cellulose synthase/poly-beta-1,6-N-acetylglucosamine synthase-like glycosyltransferase
MTITFYILAALLLLQGGVSLLEGLRYVTFVRQALAAPVSDFAPKASVILPCKGQDRELEENLRALFCQDYPDYEIVFVVATAADAALPVIERVMAEQQMICREPSGPANEGLEGHLPEVKAKVCIAGISDRRSEKVNNLLGAVEEISQDSEVLVFVDSDARVRSDWLRSLIAPLKEQTVGAATGYRWYLPERGGLFAALLSAWNGSVATTLGDHNRNFAWGGSTAILKKTFERLKVKDAWQQAVSDDYALTRVVQKSGLRIAFVPRCLTVSKEDATLGSLLEFTTRQVIITRVYNAKLWWTGIVSQVLFNLVFFGGLLFVLAKSFADKPPGIAPVMLIAIYVLGCAKGVLRVLAAGAMLPQEKRQIRRLWWVYVFGWILVSIIYLYNFIKSATTRRIVWRGVIYDLRSPAETKVIRRQ